MLEVASSIPVFVYSKVTFEFTGTEIDEKFVRDLKATWLSQQIIQFLEKIPLLNMNCATFEMDINSD